MTSLVSFFIIIWFHQVVTPTGLNAKINGWYNALYACQRVIAKGISTSQGVLSTNNWLSYTCSIITFWYTKYLFLDLRGAITHMSVYFPIDWWLTSYEITYESPGLFW